MILLDNDASILIDLLKTDLVEEFFQLEYGFHVADLVIDNEVSHFVILIPDRVRYDGFRIQTNRKRSERVKTPCLKISC